jgi:hypothetical protein
MQMEIKYLELIMDFKKQNKSKNIWIGLVGVIDVSNEQLLQGAEGGYVNILALASDAKDFKSQVKLSLKCVGLKVFDFEDIDLFQSRISAYKVSAQLVRLAREVERTGKVSCGVFYIFKKNDDRKKTKPQLIAKQKGS